MSDFKRTWLPRILTGALAGIAAYLFISWLFQPGWLFLSRLSWDFTFCFNDNVPEAVGLVLGLLLWAAFGAEVGVATIPFADSGRELVVRSLLHFAVTAVTVGAWAALNFPYEPFFGLPLFLLTLVYLLVWLGRWVGWYAEVAAIREKLGLAPGPSLFKWRETLPYFGFALLLCLALPLALRLLDDYVPILSIMYAFLLLPVVGFISGVSLGKRQGFCPLYPAACVVCFLIFIPIARLFSNIADADMLPIAFLAPLLGNLAGTAWRRIKQRRGI